MNLCGGACLFVNLLIISSAVNKCDFLPLFPSLVPILSKRLSSKIKSERSFPLAGLGLSLRQPDYSPEGHNM